MRYVCPYAKRSKHVPYLLCTLSMHEDVNYTDAHNAIKAICVWQHFCGDVMQNINDEDADKKCKRLQRAQNPD